MNAAADSEWCRASEAVAALQPKFGERAKKVIAERCARGLLDSRADVLVSTFHNLMEQQIFADYGWMDVPREDARTRHAHLGTWFWERGHGSAPSQPKKLDVDWFEPNLWSDWDIGDFGIKRWFSEDADTPQWEMHEAAGVMFDRRQLDHLVGVSPDAMAAKNTRSTKFDWEVAFADVAARLYYDCDWPDVHARGVQTDIENALRNSFVRRKLPVPEETSLKNKARIILGALRAK